MRQDEAAEPIDYAWGLSWYGGDPAPKETKSPEGCEVLGTKLLFQHADAERREP